MTNQTTETIQHFIGYLHLDTELSTSRIHFKAGDFEVKSEHIAFGDPLVAAGLHTELPDALKPVEGAPPLGDDGAAGHGRPLPLANGLPVEHFEAAFPPAFNGIPGVDFGARGATAGGSSFGSVFNGKITVSYSHGGEQSRAIEVIQSNELVDLDAMFALAGTEITAGQAGLDPDDAQELAGLIATANGLIPQEAINPFPQPDGITSEHIDDPDHAPGDGPDLPTLDDLAKQDGVEVFDGVTGTIVNGNVQPATGALDVINTQGAAISQAIQLAETDLPAQSEAHDTSATSHIVNDLTPTGGVAQIAGLGGNDAVNAASIIDFSDAFGSIVILGDYHETNAIVQANILQDLDAVRMAGGGNVAGAQLDGNTVVNEASFASEDLALFNNPALFGMPVGTQWNVDVVNGDFYDSTMVMQDNAVFDNDQSEQAQANTHFTVTTGENGQLSLTQLAEFGEDYDLIIVGGDYYEFNSILQFNVVLDNDTLQLTGAGDGGAEQSATAGQNTLINDAAIINVGANGFLPLSPEVDTLVGQIQAGETSFDYSLAAGLPGNGTDAFEVLYVTGNYYDYNTVVQTNTISDADDGAQKAGNGEGASADGADQDLSAGGNAAANVAMILDVDSTSGYQFLGGEYYEDTMLVQANLVEQDIPEDLEEDGNLDAVATIAALVNTAEQQPDGSQDTSGDTGANNGGDDVMGGVMA